MLKCDKLNQKYVTILIAGRIFNSWELFAMLCSSHQDGTIKLSGLYFQLFSSNTSRNELRTLLRVLEIL